MVFDSLEMESTEMTEPESDGEIDPFEDLKARIDRILGENQYRIKANREVPQARPRYNRDWKKDKEEKKG